MALGKRDSRYLLQYNKSTMGGIYLEEQERPLKLHFIPYPAPGHMIPLCDIATLFTSNGHHVTIITTPSNAQILDNSIPSHRYLHLHIVHFPSHEVGLPDGVENLSAVSDMVNAARVHEATTLLRSPIEQFVEQHPPDCIVADFLMPWVHDVAHKLNIPRLAFNGFSLFAVCAMVNLHHSTSKAAFVPNLPHPITLNATPPKLLTRFMQPLLETEQKSYGLIVNSFAELDGEEYVELYEKSTGHKAWHLGPASLICRTSVEEKAERGQKSVVGAEQCLSWLNSKAVNSVVYICFGSLCHFPDEQLYEIACGVEASGHQFIWVVPEKRGKENENENENEKEMERWVPSGFEERNREKGMIIKGWAPQVVILGHPAIGAFLTHCGWNSTVEAVSAGVPMITWPVHDEQFYNEKLITHLRGLGVEVGAREWTFIGFGERKRLVSRDCIDKAVRRLMDGADQSLAIRRRAKEYATKAAKAVQQHGSSLNTFTALIHDLKRFRDRTSLHQHHFPTFPPK
ncbi:hypothetical protein VNO78_22619 [Psophocarpus tetragonolobus]|uniref:Glycosyltransferase n=1 Tax=Psophocarpus tetragonolobus TaxID=3891 RepID=A0AAN9XC94_PSOTE